MSFALSSSDSCGRPFGLVVTCVLTAAFGTFTASAEELPSARELVAEAVASLQTGENREPHYWAQFEIAKAHIYVGDSAAASRALLPYENDIWVPISYLGCAELEVELTGRESVIPAAL